MKALCPGLAVFFKYDFVLLDIHDFHAMDYVSFVDELIADYCAGFFAAYEDTAYQSRRLCGSTG